MEELLMATRWQDVLIGSVQAMFLVSLWPALAGAQKPPPSMCWATGLACLALCLPYSADGLWLSTAATAACALGWLALAAQQLPAACWTYLCFADGESLEALLPDVPLRLPCGRCSPEPVGDCWRVDCPRWESGQFADVYRMRKDR